MSYIEENEGYITASKLKYFLSYGGEAYKLKYIDNVCPEDEEKRYFVLGTAFDDLLSYGREYFVEKYFIDEGLLKDDLMEKLKEQGMKVDKKILIKNLKDMYYGTSKIQLTRAEGDCIFGMYAEVLRQPLADIQGKYEMQKEIISSYEHNGTKIKLRGKLDRYGNGLIRDWKTSGNIDYFEYNLDTSFDYVLSMAFYYVLVKIELGESCEVILDVLGKNKPYPYYAYKLDRARLIDKVETKIKPGLNALIECMETNTWESVYPIDYYTEGKHGDVIAHKKGDPVNRTKLMQSGVYNLTDGGLQREYIMPQL